MFTFMHCAYTKKESCSNTTPYTIAAFKGGWLQRVIAKEIDR